MAELLPLKVYPFTFSRNTYLLFWQKFFLGIIHLQLSSLLNTAKERCRAIIFRSYSETTFGSSSQCGGGGATAVIFLMRGVTAFTAGDESE